MTPASEDAAPDGRRRLLRVMTRRPGRAQVVVALLLALLGFAAAVQVSAVRSDSPYAGARRDDLVQLLESLAAARERVADQLTDLQATRDALQTSSAQRQVALVEAQRQLDTLRILSGSVGATGPGVRITIDDPEGTVGARTLLNAVEELRDAGAEAIEIDDEARVVAQSFFTDGAETTDGQLLVSGETVTAPYVLEAIGSPETLAEAAVFPGGLTEEVERLGGTVTVETPDVVVVSSLAPQADTEFAAPTD